MLVLLLIVSKCYHSCLIPKISLISLSYAILKLLHKYNHKKKHNTSDDKKSTKKNKDDNICKSEAQKK